MSQGLESCLYMGNIAALRDWGHARDFVRMQWMMLQKSQAEDFVIATGVQYSVRQFIEKTAAALGMQLKWQGAGVNEVGYWNNQPVIRIDPRYFRPTEVETLLGDPSKAKNKLDCGDGGKPPSALHPHGRQSPKFMGWCDLLTMFCACFSQTQATKRP